jgi:hypothetical protein
VRSPVVIGQDVVAAETAVFVNGRGAEGGGEDLGCLPGAGKRRAVDGRSRGVVPPREPLCGGVCLCSSLISEAGVPEWTSSNSFDVML